MNYKKVKPKSYIRKALELFQSRIGKVVTSQELAQLGGVRGKPISHNIRRIFELRDEMGYDIVNHKNNAETGLNLKVNEWVLRSRDPIPSKIRSRGVTKPIMVEVFRRDNYSCRMCGRGPSDDDPFASGRKITLHVGHLIAHKCRDDKSDNGPEHKLSAADFVTLCNVCNEGLKNQDIIPPKTLSLLDKIKQLTASEQKAIFDYLQSRWSR